MDGFPNNPISRWRKNTGARHGAFLRLSTAIDSRFWRYSLIAFALFLGVVSVGFFAYYVYIVARFEESVMRLSENTVLYDVKGKPFNVIQGEESRRYAKLEEMTVNIPKAALAIEDARFFKHFGFDPIRIGRAVISVFTPGAHLQGASTITQQLAKLTLFSHEVTYSRKFKELFAAIALEIAYSKEEILEFYLNRIYLGNRKYGIYNASQNYFGKLPSELNLSEAAIIAGMIKKPEGYSPLNDAQKTRMRQKIALRRMLELGWITREAYREAVNRKVKIKRTKASDSKRAPYFANHVLLRLLSKYGNGRVYGGGLKIYTTLNIAHQNRLEKALRDHMAEGRSFSQVAALSMEPSTGRVTALIGGFDFASSEFNRATQALRQPGSSFKPILYAAALLDGMKPGDVFVDEPVYYSNREFSDEEPNYYEPRNFNQEHLGEISLAYALQVSNNVVSVKILETLGIRKLVSLSEKMGIPLPAKQGLCLALGCGETTLLNLVNAYSSFANDGVQVKPVFILRVEDAAGKILWQRGRPEKRRVLPEEVAEEMNDMLHKAVLYGTGSNAYVQGIRGGKTGTNDDFRDAWFIGYTDSFAAGVWIGNDDNRGMDREVGGGTPARIWRDYASQF